MTYINNSQGSNSFISQKMNTGNTIDFKSSDSSMDSDSGSRSTQTELQKRIIKEVMVRSDI